MDKEETNELDAQKSGGDKPAKKSVSSEIVAQTIGAGGRIVAAILGRQKNELPPEKSRTDNMIERIKNHRVLSIFIVIGIVVMAVSAFWQSVERFIPDEALGRSGLCLNGEVVLIKGKSDIPTAEFKADLEKDGCRVIGPEKPLGDHPLPELTLVKYFYNKDRGSANDIKDVLGEKRRPARN